MEAMPVVRVQRPAAVTPATSWLANDGILLSVPPDYEAAVLASMAVSSRPE